MALTERFAIRRELKSKLTPSTQALFINILTPGKYNLSKSETVKDLNLSDMTISRAYLELKKHRLLKSYKLNNSTIWEREGTIKELWEDGNEYLFNPIQSIVYVKSIAFPKVENSDFYGSSPFVRAGESALAELSMLGHPKIETVAIYSKDWNEIKNRFVIYLEEEMNIIRVEIWKHKILMFKNRIHQVPLYLTLMNEYDERIQMCLDDMLEAYFLEVTMND